MEIETLQTKPSITETSWFFRYRMEIETLQTKPSITSKRVADSNLMKFS
jgi:hypothetical protein